MRPSTPGLRVTTERLAAAAPALRARADELARIRADAARVLGATGEELAGLRTAAAVEDLADGTGRACDRLVHAVDRLAAAMQASARRYDDADREAGR